MRKNTGFERDKDKGEMGEMRRDKKGMGTKLKTVPKWFTSICFFFFLVIISNFMMRRCICCLAKIVNIATCTQQCLSYFVSTRIWCVKTEDFTLCGELLVCYGIVHNWKYVSLYAFRGTMHCQSGMDVSTALGVSALRSTLEGITV